MSNNETGSVLSTETTENRRQLNNTFSENEREEEERGKGRGGEGVEERREEKKGKD
jgi:hypothetical protein